MDAGSLCNKAAVLGAAIKERLCTNYIRSVKMYSIFKPILFSQKPSLHYYQDPVTRLR
jgi:hypothetical protein